MMIPNKQMLNKIQNSNFNKFEKINENEIKDNYNTLPSYGLSHVFIGRRSNIVIDKLKTSSNEYIYDLSNTWELNLDLLLNFSKDSFTKPSDQIELSGLISKIKTYFTTKNSKRQELANSKGKLLIEKQIYEEYKRKIEENYEFFKDQIREMEENVDNKEEYIKIFEKKLREVEIYVQKNTKTLVNTKYDKYKNFIMNDFINENTEMLRKKEQLENEKIEYINIVNEATTENTELKFNNNVKFDDDNLFYELDNNKNVEEIISCRLNNIDLKENNKINLKKQKSEKLKIKLKNLMKSYNNHIKLIENKNKLLRSQMKDLHNKFLNQNKLKKIIQKIKRENNQVLLDKTFDHGANQFNIAENTNNITFVEKSNINLDITKKLATYMDFSTVLNKRDETNFNDLSANKTGDNIFNMHHHDRNIWDVSCIEKN